MEASSAKQEGDREWSLREGKLENWRGETDRKAPASSPGRWDRSTLLRAAGNDLGGGGGGWELGALAVVLGILAQLELVRPGGDQEGHPGTSSEKGRVSVTSACLTPWQLKPSLPGSEDWVGQAGSWPHRGATFPWGTPTGWRHRTGIHIAPPKAPPRGP